MHSLSFLAGHTAHFPVQSNSPSLHLFHLTSAFVNTITRTVCSSAVQRSLQNINTSPSLLAILSLLHLRTAFAFFHGCITLAVHNYSGLDYSSITKGGKTGTANPGCQCRRGTILMMPSNIVKFINNHNAKRGTALMADETRIVLGSRLKKQFQ